MRVRSGLLLVPPVWPVWHYPIQAALDLGAMLLSWIRKWLRAQEKLFLVLAADFNLQPRQYNAGFCIFDKLGGCLF